jgi:hypothetical protein
MAEILMFNPNTLAQMFVSASNHNDIERLKADGWIQNPRLVAMYHPELKKHQTVNITEQKLWEAKGYFAEPTFIYHPNESHPKLVSAEDAKKAMNNGWYSSPAHFPGNSEGKLKTKVFKEAIA